MNSDTTIQQCANLVKAINVTLLIAAQNPGKFPGDFADDTARAMANLLASIPDALFAADEDAGTGGHRWN